VIFYLKSLTLFSYIFSSFHFFCFYLKGKMILFKRNKKKVYNHLPIAWNTFQDFINFNHWKCNSRWRWWWWRKEEKENNLPAIHPPLLYGKNNIQIFSQILLFFYIFPYLRVFCIIILMLLPCCDVHDDYSFLHR